MVEMGGVDGVDAKSSSRRTVWTHNESNRCLERPFGPTTNQTAHTSWDIELVADDQNGGNSTTWIDGTISGTWNT